MPAGCQCYPRPVTAESWWSCLPSAESRFPAADVRFVYRAERAALCLSSLSRAPTSRTRDTLLERNAGLDHVMRRFAAGPDHVRKRGPTLDSGFLTLANDGALHFRLL